MIYLSLSEVVVKSIRQRLVLNSPVPELEAFTERLEVCSQNVVLVAILIKAEGPKELLVDVEIDVLPECIPDLPDLLALRHRCQVYLLFLLLNGDLLLEGWCI